MRMKSCALALAVLLSACVGVSTPNDEQGLIEDGRAIAEAQCSRCHAIGTSGESPRPEAPVFRTVLSRYNANALDEELIAGIQVNHEMPDFQFNPQGADALVAYLRSIQEESAPTP